MQRLAPCPRRLRSERGFTLVELLVAAAITVGVVGLVLATFLSQQRSFAALELARGAQEGARDALLEMEQSLRLLGWGIDPRWGIDVQHYRCASPASCVRDRVDGPDEIVFYARNPSYHWVEGGTATCPDVRGCFTAGNAWTIAGTAPFKLNARKGDVFHKGRILLATCDGGATPAMVTVAATTKATEDGPLEIPLQTFVADHPYRDAPNAVPTRQACLYAAFFVDRYRYAVETIDGTPYLVLDTGLDLNENGQTPDEGDAADLLPIAAGAEDLQIAYLLDPSATQAPPDSNRNWVIGDAAGVQEQPNGDATAPTYDTAPQDPSRFNLHPTNVRAVRLALTLRSLSTDQAPPPGWEGDPLVLAENRNVQPASLGRYRRFSFTTTVNARNMASRGGFLF